MIIKSDFTPAPQIQTQHAQTIWPWLFRPRPKIVSQRERIDLPDGDFIHLDWLEQFIEGPIVLILHGLGGSIKSNYVTGLMQTLDTHGFRSVTMHLRGCSGEPNNTSKSYHSGQSEDLQFVIESLKRNEPNTPIFVVGFSLGGNLLLKCLGEQGRASGIEAAVAVSVPYDLALTAERINQGFSKIYQWYLLQNLKNNVRQKRKQFILPIEVNRALQAKNFFEFDNAYTAPLNGFKDVHDYYTRCSSKQFLRGIKTPTLLLHANDDPFIPPAAIPTEQELSRNVHMKISETGGHVGFVSMCPEKGLYYWVDKTIVQFFTGKTLD